MQISDIRTYLVDAQQKRTWLFVEVSTDEGEVGIGEASQSRFDRGVRMLLEQWKPRLVGRDPGALIEPLRKQLLLNPFASRAEFAAFSGLEQALWDLIGKGAGMPVSRLLGGPHSSRVRVYATLFAGQDNAPDALARVAANSVADGFSAVKIYPFPYTGTAAGPLTPEERKLAIERVSAVRSAIGPDVELLTDWAWAVTPGDARRMAELFAEFNLFWIEEPFVSGDAGALAEFRRVITPRLAGGEQLHGLRSFKRRLECRALDVLMPDVKWIGGILATKQLAGMAEAFDVEVAPHNASGPVAAAASLQVSATVPNLTMLEFGGGSVPWRAELVRGSEQIEAGHLLLSDRPGLGIEFDREIALGRAAEW